MNGFLHGFGVDVATQPVLDFHTGEIRRWLRVLLGAEFDFVPGYLLAFLAEYADHIKPGAATKGQQGQLDRLGSRVAVGIVHDQGVAGS